MSSKAEDAANLVPAASPRPETVVVIDPAYAPEPEQLYEMALAEARLKPGMTSALLKSGYLFTARQAKNASQLADENKMLCVYVAHLEGALESANKQNRSAKLLLGISSVIATLGGMLLAPEFAIGLTLLFLAILMIIVGILLDGGPSVDELKKKRLLDNAAKADE